MPRQYSLNGTKLYDMQEAWIEDHFGADAAVSANYGWGVDEVEGLIQTKIYNHGILITDTYGNHEFEPFDFDES